MKKSLSILGMLILLLLGIVRAEITINQGSISNELYNHDFVVNTLPSSGTNILPPVNPAGMSLPGMVVEPIVSARIIPPCGQANFSFKMTNQGPSQKIYSFEVADFSGTAFITQNLMLNPKEAKIVDVILVPQCSGTTALNPSIHIESDDEELYLPLIINVEGKYIDPDECEYYYNESTCRSPYYLRIKKGGMYTLDLKEWYYDPDSDNLEYTYTKSSNLDVGMVKGNAKISPSHDFIGPERIVFYASDGKGGVAESKTFYVQIISAEPTFWEQVMDLFGL